MTPELLFVQGAQSSGTSTLIGMLNAHPSVFMLYETRMDRLAVSRYGGQFLERYPQLRPLFRNTRDIGIPYEKLGTFLGEQPVPGYRFVGDKVISLDPEETCRVRPHRTIYVLRDVRTWLCKTQISRWYRTDLDIVAPALELFRLVAGSCRHPQSIRVTMEDLIRRNDDMLGILGEFLDLNLRDHATEWWLRVGNHPADDPKSAQSWASVHPSSSQAPEKLDTEVELAPHPFWDEFLPLFDHYHSSGRADAALAESASRDIERVEALMRYAPLTLDKAFAKVSTANFGAPQTEGNNPPTPPQEGGILKRIGSLLGVRHRGA